MTLVTVDFEADWGGRRQTYQGIEEGIPFILACLAEAQAKAIFFISTSCLDACLPLAQRVKEEGHTIGSHGHKHKRFKNWKEWRLDYLQSMQLLEKNLGIKRPLLYRAPKFNYIHPEHRYSDPKGHTSLLKHIWTRQPLREILYLHPFDLVKPVSKAPDLFCKVWYSRPTEARERFRKIVREMAPSSS